MMTPILYSTGCPRCKVLETKLQQKGIEFYEANDEKEMEERGIMSVPVLDVDGALLPFKEAIDWVNGR